MIAIFKDEDILDAAIQVAAAEARIAFWDGYEGAEMALREANSADHLASILEPYFQDEDARVATAQAVARVSYRTVESSARPLSDAVREYLHGLMVGQRPDGVDGAAVYRCNICSGVAETPANFRHMHNPHCPLRGHAGGAVDGEGDPPPAPLPEIL